MKAQGARSPALSLPRVPKALEVLLDFFEYLHVHVGGEKRVVGLLWFWGRGKWELASVRDAP